MRATPILVLACLLLATHAPAADIARAQEVPGDEGAGASSSDEIRRLRMRAVELRRLARFDEAEATLDEALAQAEALYPAEEHPEGHLEIARAWTEMGDLFQTVAEYDRAAHAHARAAAILSRLHPEETHPDGQVDLAASLHRLGVASQFLGDAERARTVLEGALEMRRRLRSRPPTTDEQVAIAGTYERLGHVLHHLGEAGKAGNCFETQLSILTELYPEATHPDGHPDLLRARINLAGFYTLQGEGPTAAEHLAGARRMGRALYAETPAPPPRGPETDPERAGRLARLEDLVPYMLRESAGGRHATAGTTLDEVIRIYLELYPPDLFPDGHPDLAGAIRFRGILRLGLGEIEEARRCFLAAHDMLFGPFPGGHPEMTRALGDLGSTYLLQGDLESARAIYERAAQIQETLFPAAVFPDGHPELARCLVDLGYVLAAQAEYEAARPHLERAVAICRAAGPADHPLHARALDTLAKLHESRERHEDAGRLFEAALEMRRRLYPADRFPEGHLQLAQSLDNLGQVLAKRGKLDDAASHMRSALEMTRRLLPPESHPEGHPHLVRRLRSLGALANLRTDLDEAHDLLVRALEMQERAYPAERFPGGHPALALDLKLVAAVELSRGEHDRATERLERAAAMDLDFARGFLGGASESEALNFCATYLRTPSLLLSASRGSSRTADEVYRHLWPRRRLIQRILEERQRAASSSEDPAIAEARAEAIEVRAEISRLALAPAHPDPEKASAVRNRLVRLTTRKEELERLLATERPEAEATAAGEARPHRELIDALPEKSVFVDLVRYERFERLEGVAGEDGIRLTPAYAAFVLRPGQATARLELGEAGPLDTLVERWRTDVQRSEKGAAAGELRRSVWEAIEKTFPEGTATVFISPDGAFTRLAWAALPGDDPDDVLLERYAFARVPHGPFLLERLTRRHEPDAGGGEPGALLLVGDVDYDAAPPAHGHGHGHDSHPAVGDAPLRWRRLAGSRAEMDLVARRAGERPVRSLGASEATTPRVVEELGRARWAHVATHGFFADARTRSALALDERSFGRTGLEAPGERATPGGRNPLLLSGIVCAGANAATADDRGILTAEAIAALPLEGLDLVVLSACETGLGEVAGGEGVLGLQRAFHTAGADGVIASLWKVDDQASAALMNLFYGNLWEKGMPALQALREAQLSIYRNPGRIAEWAGGDGGSGERGGEPDGEGGDDPDAPAGGKPAWLRGTASPKLWAAFVLSGGG